MTVTLADPYLSQNEGRRYPLADDSTGLSDASIVDFRCAVRTASAGSTPFASVSSIERVTVGGRDFVRISVRLSDGPSEIGVLPFDVPADIAPGAPFTAYATSDLASGSLTVTAALLDEEEGDCNVPFARTTVVADVLKVDSVRSHGSVEATDPTVTHDPTARLSGRVVLIAGYNTEPYLDGNRVRINVSKGGGIGEWCQTVGSGQTCSNVLFTINGERPGSDGDIRLLGADGVRITPLPDEHALRIELDDAAEERMLAPCGNACQLEDQHD